VEAGGVPLEGGFGVGHKNSLDETGETPKPRPPPPGSDKYSAFAESRGGARLIRDKRELFF